MFSKYLQGKNGGWKGMERKREYEGFDLSHYGTCRGAAGGALIRVRVTRVVTSGSCQLLRVRVEGIWAGCEGGWRVVIL